MNFDQIIKLLDTITALLQVLIWPIIIVFPWRAFKLFTEKQLYNKDVSELGLGVGPSGLNVTFKKQVNIATSLVQANVEKQLDEGITNPTLSSSQKDAIVKVVSMATQPATVQRIAGAKLLWVDDRPENNLYPRKAMEELGIQITVSTSTEDALEKIHSSTYDPHSAVSDNAFLIILYCIFYSFCCFVERIMQLQQLNKISENSIWWSGNTCISCIRSPFLWANYSILKKLALNCGMWVMMLSSLIWDASLPIPKLHTKKWQDMICWINSENRTYQYSFYHICRFGINRASKRNA